MAKRKKRNRAQNDKVAGLIRAFQNVATFIYHYTKLMLLIFFGIILTSFKLIGKNDKNEQKAHINFRNYSPISESDFLLSVFLQLILKLLLRSNIMSLLTISLVT